MEDLKAQNAGQDELNRQMSEVKAAEDFQRRTVQMNNQVERQTEYGAIGAVAGTAIGTAIGSLIAPGIGTAVGSVIGGIIGDYLGTKAADLVNQSENNAQQNSSNSGNDPGFYARLRGDDPEQEKRDHEYSRGVYGEIVGERIGMPLDVQPVAQSEGENSEYQFQMDLVPHITPTEMDEKNVFTRIMHDQTPTVEDWNQSIASAGGNTAAVTDAVYVDEETAAAREQALIERGAEVAKIREKNLKTQAETFHNFRSDQPIFAPNWDYGENLSKEDYKALAAYDLAQADEKARAINAQHAEEKALQNAFYKQRGQSYSEMVGNTQKSEKGSDEWVTDTNPYNVAKKNFDEQAAASQKQINAQNEFNQTIRDLNKQAQQNAENKDFSIGDFLESILFNKAAAQKLHDEEDVESITKPTLQPDNLSHPQLENPQFEEKSFNISDMLPDFSLSEWLSEKTADIDLASILPDFSTVGETIGEQLNVIPEKISEVGASIGETFAQIPTAATEAFNTISTSASEGLTSIQTAWNELPGFFDGLFAGLGGVATSAGAAIASGINSAIGTIQSAWESLSSWLSSKISSLASMASNAASTIMNFGDGDGGVGHNATGTASWRGGFTEVNEQGGEIIDLPSGARIYPHATTMKMLQSDLKAGRLDELIQSSGFGLDTPAAFEYDALGNIKGYSGMADNLIQEGDLSPVREAKLQAQREFMNLSAFPQEFQAPELSTFPQAFDVSGLTQGITNNSTTSNTTTTTNNTNSGLTVTGNTFTINKGSDIDELVYKIFQMMSDIQANHAGI